MRRWLRCLVCLLVICALLVNLSPLRVKATGVTAGGVVVGVGITIAVAAALNALGVRQGSDSSSFSEIVNSCADALSPRFAVDGLVTFLSLTQNGLGKTYASKNFLQAILDWFFGNKVLFYNDVTWGSSHSVSINDVSYAIEAWSSYNCLPCCIKFSYPRENGDIFYSCRSFILLSGGTKCYVNGSSKSYESSYNYGGYNTVYLSGSGSTGNIFDGYIYSGFYDLGVHNFSSEDECDAFLSSFSLSFGASTAQDLTLEAVGQDVDTDYKTYVDTGIVDEDDIPYVPVTIPSLGTDTFIDQSQAEAQAGTTAQEIIDQLVDAESVPGTDSGTITVPETVTLKDILTGILSVPKSIAQAISAFFADVVAAVQAIPVAIAEFFTPTPPDSHEKFALIDLSKYFPFCIPFDLFDFFTLLNADPVAPVLSWEIQDLSGQTYALSVNLSEWDSVAQLFRRLQLFLFICGLAAASRKYIKW